MRLLALPVVALVLAACGNKSPHTRGPAQLPPVMIAAIPAPPNPEVVMKPGENLHLIAEVAYGHGRFAGFMASFNGIADPERIAAGLRLRAPSLAFAFEEAGADPLYQPALNALAKACTDYYAAEPAYLEARRGSGVSTGTFKIPSDIQKTFFTCADAIDAAVTHLDSAKPPHAVPKSAIGQFQGAAAEIRGLARGLIDGYGYDYDMVGQRFGLAFTYAMIWTKQQHR